MSYQSRMLTRQIAKLQRDRDRLLQPEVSPDLISPFLALPMLRGFWAGSVDNTGGWRDISGLNNILSPNGNPQVIYLGLPSVWAYDGVGDFHSITDAASGNSFDISGLETYVFQQGLTLGGWFVTDHLARADPLMSKWTDAGNQHSYLLYKSAANTLNFYTSLNGADFPVVTSTVAAMTTWMFIVGRFDPGANLDIFVNGIWTSNAVAPASLFQNNEDFEIGAYNAGGVVMAGGASTCFICAAMLSDAHISNAFQQTRGAFGV